MSPTALSWEGRPLSCARYGPPSSEDALLVVGGVHGDEPASVEAVRSLMAFFDQQPPRVATWIVPALNVDGLARGSKDNARGVDLNRNFPSRNFTLEHPPGYCPGAHPLSEPETAWLAALMEAEQIRGIVAVHAPFACVNFDGPAAAWAVSVAEASGWPARASLGYPTPGSLGSWFGVDRGLPILTLELPPGAWVDFAMAGDRALQAAVAFWERSFRAR